MTECNVFVNSQQVTFLEFKTFNPLCKSWTKGNFTEFCSKTLPLRWSKCNAGLTTPYFLIKAINYGDSARIKRARW